MRFNPLVYLNCDSDDCADTTPEGAVDEYGFGCDDGYLGFESSCGNYNDVDFVSEEMCCACGGGDVPGISYK